MACCNMQEEVDAEAVVRAEAVEVGVLVVGARGIGLVLDARRIDLVPDAQGIDLVQDVQDIDPVLDVQDIGLAVP